MAVPVLAAGVALLTGSPAFAADTAPVYTVTQEGVTSDQAAKIADTFGVTNQQQGGAFDYTSPAQAAVPQKRVAAGKDEDGNATTSLALDMDAIQSLKVLPNDSAERLGSQLLAIDGLSPDLKATPSVSHTMLELSNADSKLTGRYPLDTAVSYNLTLNGLPVTGQGAKLRIAFAGDGSVTQLSDNIRSLQRGRDMPIITPDEAAKQCSALYGAGVKQGAPTLGYLFPAIGAVKTIYPVYTCNPVADTAQANRQIPAIAGTGPQASMRAIRKGTEIIGDAAVRGGTGPYTYKWSSSTAVIGSASEAHVDYQMAPRDGKPAGEQLTLEVTDANGLTTTASAPLMGDGSVTVASTPGGGGFGKLGAGTQVGIENMVDEWQCAQDSATGFRNEMTSHGIPWQFDFRGTNAWESDFKSSALAGGNDSSFVDDVDMQWYTGHGWPGGFTFKDTTHNDGSIVPADANWGNGDLEWLQLESCQVLQDTTGTGDYFSRWGGAINGLHMLNGFDTSAYCIGGGTGADFADYLFPYTFLGITLRQPLTVRQAWQQMAIDKEPSGVKFRSMGNIGAGGVTNIGDHFWGQGTVGPDISKASRTGMWAISGTV
jgi:hypothetical protein